MSKRLDRLIKKVSELFTLQFIIKIALIIVATMQAIKLLKPLNNEILEDLTKSKQIEPFFFNKRYRKSNRKMCKKGCTIMRNEGQICDSGDLCNKWTCSNLGGCIDKNYCKNDKDCSRCELTNVFHDLNSNVNTGWVTQPLSNQIVMISEH